MALPADLFGLAFLPISFEFEHVSSSSPPRHRDSSTRLSRKYGRTLAPTRQNIAPTSAMQAPRRNCIPVNFFALGAFFLRRSDGTSAQARSINIAT
jgi:hypothetical protein